MQDRTILGLDFAIINEERDKEKLSLSKFK